MTKDEPTPAPVVTDAMRGFVQSVAEQRLNDPPGDAMNRRDMIIRARAAMQAAQPIVDGEKTWRDAQANYMMPDSEVVEVLREVVGLAKNERAGPRTRLMHIKERAAALLAKLDRKGEGA